MQNYILDVVISLRSREIDKVPLSVIEHHLKAIGMEIDKQFLIDFLSSINGVVEVNPGRDEVIFNTAGPERGVSDDEAAREQEKIEKTATKVAKDNIEKSNKVPNLGKK
ncbi:MAG: hypothetical protein HC836_31840 [Richelia sp. RM2_1_2]|nr:hypothetical protein [Richelia sp. RM2_1_2]